MILRVELIAALMKIRRRRLGRKGVKPQVVQPLWIERKRNCRSLFRAEHEVELSIGIETLEFRVTLRWWKAVHRRPHVAVLERLCYGDAVFHDRTGESRPRRRGPEAHDASVAIPQPRHEVLDREMKFVVVTGLSGNGGNRSGKSSILRVIRV